MDIIDELGFPLALLAGLVVWASIIFATLQTWRYLEKSERLGSFARRVIIALVVVSLFFGTWLLFDVMWIIKWVISRAKRNDPRIRPLGGVG